MKILNEQRKSQKYQYKRAILIQPDKKLEGYTHKQACIGTVPDPDKSCAYSVTEGCKGGREDPNRPPYEKRS